MADLTEPPAAAGHHPDASAIEQITGGRCCDIDELSSCCEPAAKDDCCGTTEQAAPAAPSSCGCLAPPTAQEG